LERKVLKSVSVSLLYLPGNCVTIFCGRGDRLVVTYIGVVLRSEAHYPAVNIPAESQNVMLMDTAGASRAYETCTRMVMTT
jgi:hypothetical protein